ncbi:hypothetical protein B566_EDAN002207 [Ephemera danica]|nr:hypothetical protein B566_EDAN002207 [Ephemera danica]
MRRLVLSPPSVCPLNFSLFFRSKFLFRAVALTHIIAATSRTRVWCVNMCDWRPTVCVLPKSSVTLFISVIILALGSIALATDNAPALKITDIMSTKTYDRLIPPTHPTTVKLHVQVLSLDSFDETSMSYSVSLFLGQTWTEPRLIIPRTNDTREYKLINVDWTEYLWTPDLFFKNAKDSSIQTVPVPNHYVWLYYQDKTIFYMLKAYVTSSCDMDFKAYPHDTQICQLKMESRNFSCLVVSFKLSRNVGYFFFHTYIPLYFIIFLSWISFWAPPEAALARISLGGTCLLAAAALLARCHSSAPHVMQITAIEVFTSVCTLFGFLALIEYFLVLFFLGDVYHKSSSGLPDVAAKIDWIARIAFPLFFVIFNMIYWVVVAAL